MAYLNFEELKKIDNINKRYKASQEAFSEARNFASKRLADIFAERNYKILDIATELGIDAGGLSRSLKSNFSAPSHALVKLCYGKLGISVHDLFFGEQVPTMLSKDISMIISRCISDTLYRLEIEKILEEVYSDPKKKETDENLVARDRRLEVTSDRFLMKERILGEKTPIAIRTGIKKSEYMETRSAGVPTLMFLALELGTSLDYFVARDYTGYGYAMALPVKLFSETHNEDVIEDRQMLKIISEYCKLNKDGKKEVFTRSMVKSLSAN